jgi:hypothetical protein
VNYLKLLLSPAARASILAGECRQLHLRPWLNSRASSQQHLSHRTSVQLAAEISIALAWQSTDFAASTSSLFPPRPHPTAKTIYFCQYSLLMCCAP